MRTVYAQFIKNSDGEALTLDATLEAAKVDEKGRVGYFDLTPEQAREFGAKARKMYESEVEAETAGEDLDDCVTTAGGRVVA
ncbi:MAG: hypothetical protein L0229_20335 [Blastocatellia bacterium]|nr:hypothetical protein [Blastocatellia bacterium]